MAANWHPKPGDRVIRRPRLSPPRLRRILGITSLYSAGYGNVGSSIYYALGLIAVVAAGATPVVLLIAGIIFIFTALTYAEGTAMYPEAGGSSSFARHGFNESLGFVAGWALMLSYVVTMAISAFTVPFYLAYFWPPLKESPVAATSLAIVIILLLAALNLRGVKETSFLNITLAVMDVAMQVLVVVLGLVFLFNPGLILQRVTSLWPSTTNLISGIAVAAIAYTGVETISQLAEETKHPQVRAPRAYLLMMLTVMVIFTGISTIAFSVMSPQELAQNWSHDPLAGIVHYLPIEIAAKAPSDPVGQIVYIRLAEVMGAFLPFLVALLASTILLIAANSGLMGISRLAFSLGHHRLVPPVLGRVHHRFHTPYVSIAIFSGVAILILLPAFFRADFFSQLGSLYAFGSLFSFALAHAAILMLRIRKPETPRPFKLRANIRFGNCELPITAILGLLSTFAVWIILVIVQPYSRWLGFAWMLAGLVLYSIYRHRAKTRE